MVEVLRDRVLVCKDCNTDFVLTAKDQEFFLKKKWSQPKRCKVCRKIKREAQEKKELGV